MIGPNYKVLPYLVDNALEAKVNQPQSLMKNVRKITIKNTFQVSISLEKLDRIQNIVKVIVFLKTYQLFGVECLISFFIR